MRKEDGERIEKVHLIFKSHLDIGFTDLPSNVVKQYLHNFMPEAITLAETTRLETPDSRFKWTTGSWLIYKYLEDADRQRRDRMEKAIEAGDIHWHALPFTMHSELLDASLFALGTELSAALDRRFGIKTTAAKMTDVPGHTRGIIPRLKEAGVEFLHIGANAASSHPKVPSVFEWHAPDGSSVAVMYQREYGGVMHIPHTSEAVAIVHAGDNQSPQNGDDVAEVYQALRNQFPGAEVAASDLSEIGKTISAISCHLPVIKGELGDSWIHGIGSDPFKIAQFRELSRLRQTWIRSGDLQEGGVEDVSFGLPLVMIAEHTWGLDVKSHLKSWSVYTPEALNGARSTERFSFIESAWDEKRAYINDAVNSLPAGMKKNAKTALKSLLPKMPVLNGFTKIESLGSTFETPQLCLAMDPSTGALTNLLNRESGRQWASNDYPLALFSYQTFSNSDYDRYKSQYIAKPFDWAFQDFGKPGMEIFEPVSRTYRPRATNAWKREDNKKLVIIAHMELMDDLGNPLPGCPKLATLAYEVSVKEPLVDIELQWFNKAANRLPEAMWLSFVPRTTIEGNWLMDKMGYSVDPRDVVGNGGRKLHAISESIRYSDSLGAMSVESLDAPLVAPGERTLLNFDNACPSPGGGMHSCVYNNVWGTNFVMWFDEDMRFRFRLNCGDGHG